MSTPLQHFNSLVSRDEKTGCWNWTGYCSSKRSGERPRMYVDGTQQSASRWAYSHFIGEIPDGLLVCHKCDNHRCVNPDHLFVGTHSDNSQDMINKGRSMRGTKNPSAKLSEDDVRYIRRVHIPGSREFSLENLAKKFNVSGMAICKIVNNKSWKHVMASREESR